MKTTIKRGDIVGPNHKGEDYRRRVIDWTVYRGRAISDPYTIGTRTYVDVAWFRDAKDHLPRQYDFDLLQKQNN